MWKRIILLIVGMAIMLMAGCSSSSVSKDFTSEEDFAYDVGDEGVAICGYMGKSKEVTIPERIEGKPVIEIEANAFSGANIVKVSIPKTVKTIGQNAFDNCLSLEIVDFKGNGQLVEIGRQSFANCPELDELRLPSAAYFEMKLVDEWLEDLYITIKVPSDTEIELPFDEDDATIIVVKSNSPVHKILLADATVHGRFRAE